MSEPVTKKVKTELFDKDGNPVYVVTEQGSDGKERISSIVNAAGVSLTAVGVGLTEVIGGLVDLTVAGVVKGTGLIGRLRERGQEPTHVDIADMFKGKTDKEKIAAHKAAIDELKNSNDS